MHVTTAESMQLKLCAWLEFRSCRDLIGRQACAPASLRGLLGVRSGDVIISCLIAELCDQASASAMALPQVTVSAGPLRSRVRSFGSASTVSIAETMALAASGSPRCSSIIAPDQI
jgi:hypothetical protein